MKNQHKYVTEITAAFRVWAGNNAQALNDAYLHDREWRQRFREYGYGLGDLMVRGEKQLALTEGMEIIQVSGIIRPDDVSPNNTVQSRRLANAQIAYRGTGDLANASRPGWGTSGLLKFWPF
jgi:hypothetical protein